MHVFAGSKIWPRWHHLNDMFGKCQNWFTERKMTLASSDHSRKFTIEKKNCFPISYQLYLLSLSLDETAVPRYHWYEECGPSLCHYLGSLDTIGWEVREQLAWVKVNSARASSGTLVCLAFGSVSCVLPAFYFFSFNWCIERLGCLRCCVSDIFLLHSFCFPPSSQARQTRWRCTPLLTTIPPADNRGEEILSNFFLSSSSSGPSFSPSPSFYVSCGASMRRAHDNYILVDAELLLTFNKRGCFHELFPSKTISKKKM